MKTCDKVIRGTANIDTHVYKNQKYGEKNGDGKVL